MKVSKLLVVKPLAGAMVLVALLFTDSFNTAQAQSGPAGVRGALAVPLLSGGGTVDLTVPLFKSRMVKAGAATNRVSVANPDIADIVVISATELYVLGKDLGTTNVLLWDRENHLIGSIAVEVSPDVDNLKQKLAEVLPGQAVENR